MEKKIKKNLIRFLDAKSLRTIHPKLFLCPDGVVGLSWSPVEAPTRVRIPVRALKKTSGPVAQLGRAPETGQKW